MHKAIVFDFNRTLYDPDNETLISGAKEILEFLQEHSIPLFLVCKGNEERRKKIMELGLEQFFQKIIVTEHKGPDDFMECISAYPEREFVVIGDRLNEEIRYGLACGMTAIWFQSGKFSNEIPDDIRPHFTITSLPELHDMPLLTQP